MLVKSLYIRLTSSICRAKPFVVWILIIWLVPPENSLFLLQLWIIKPKTHKAWHQPATWSDLSFLLETNFYLAGARYSQPWSNWDLLRISREKFVTETWWSGTQMRQFCRRENDGLMILTLFPLPTHWELSIVFQSTKYYVPFFWSYINLSDNNKTLIENV